MKISIDARIEQEIDAVWWAWNDPDCVVKWNAASDEWHTTCSRVDLAGHFEQLQTLRGGGGLTQVRPGQ